jgi:hypothetical protein
MPVGKTGKECRLASTVLWRGRIVCCGLIALALGDRWAFLVLIGLGNVFIAAIVDGLLRWRRNRSENEHKAEDR